jgi:hypothetical protein
MIAPFYNFILPLKGTEMITLQEIRTQYPHPVSYRDVWPDTAKGPETHYCVGGALCSYLGHKGLAPKTYYGFPQAYKIRQALMIANPRLTLAIADTYANGLMVTNDISRDFEAAWNLLETALTF